MTADESARLRARVRAWVADDVEPSDQAELEALLTDAEAHPGGASAEALRHRFAGPLAFGTAGLRGRVEAGESRMNRATVIRATAGLADHVLASVDGASDRGVVLARDARRGSEAFARDAAAVLSAKGLRVWRIPEPAPTPVVPFAVHRLGAAAGVVVTASHNPAPDNGYKVYWDHGGQIAPPLDEAIAAAIERQPGARHVPRDEAGQRVEDRPDLLEGYQDALARVSLVPEAPVENLRVVYTALHGVAGRPFVDAFRRRGIPVRVVEDQHEPDPAFPTVSFPNPEEPDTWERALDLAESEGADLVLANDPDGDRLGAAVPGPDGGWIRLSGNDIGVLLARHMIDHDEPGDASRLVVSTVVSSQLLSRMARDLGVRHAECLTGFKHISARMRELETKEGLRALMGYEEALGFAVSREVQDKDGLSAGLMLAEMAAVAKSEGRTVLDVLDAIHRAHGLFVGWGRSFTFNGPRGPEEASEAMARLRSMTSETWEALGVTEVQDLRTQGGGASSGLRANLLLLQLRDGRIALRPSGTEPKLKIYLEKRVPWPATQSKAEASKGATDELRAIENQLRAWVGFDPVR